MGRFNEWSICGDADGARSDAGHGQPPRCKLVVLKGAQRGTEFVIAGDVIPDRQGARERPRAHRRDRVARALRDRARRQGLPRARSEEHERHVPRRRRGQRGLPARRLGDRASVRAELKFTPFEERIEILPPRRSARRDGRQVARDARDLRPARAHRADRRDRPDRGRDRHRQGHDRAHAPPAVAARRRAVRRGRLRRGRAAR